MLEVGGAKFPYSQKVVRVFESAENRERLNGRETEQSPYSKARLRRQIAATGYV
jgi:hypothetical protein